MTDPDEHPSSNLQAQAREARDRLRSVEAPKRREAPPPSFGFWFTTSLIVVVACLSYFLIPSMRDRIQERIQLLVAGDQRETEAPSELPPKAAATVSTTLPLTVRPRGKSSSHQASVPVKFRSVVQASRPSTPPPAPPVPKTRKRPRRRDALQRGAPVLKRGPGVRAEEIQSTQGELPETAEGGDEEDQSPNADAAYKILLDKIPRMAAVAEKTDESWEMKSWTVVRSENSEVWIDLIAVNKTGGRDEHFIWKVHVDDLTVQPLSQSARRIVAK